MSHTDIMTSPVPGLVPQMVCFCGSAKFNHTSFFVQDKSDYTFVHHQTSTSAEETINAKHAYEHELLQYGKELRHYHADTVTYEIAKHRE